MNEAWKQRRLKDAGVQPKMEYDIVTFTVDPGDRDDMEQALITLAVELNTAGREGWRLVSGPTVTPTLVFAAVERELPL